MGTGTYNILIGYPTTPFELQRATNLLYATGYVTNIATVSGNVFEITYSGTDATSDEIQADLIYALRTQGINFILPQ